MAAIDRSVEIRATLDKWYTIIVIALLVASLALGFWAYQVNMVPEVQQEERLVEDWTETTDFNHSAAITQTTHAFQAGEVVENRPLYYTNLSDTLDGTYTYQYMADSGDVDVTTDATLHISAGELDGTEITDTYWEVAQPLASEETSGLGPNEPMHVDYSVDIMEVIQIIDQEEVSLGASEGLIDVRVIATSTVDGEVDGETHVETYQSEKIMVVTPATFRVTDLNTISESHEEFTTVESIVEPDLFESYGSIVLFGLVLTLLLGTLLARNQGYMELTDEERELLQIKQDRERFSEWISRGTFPSEREYDETILVDSLEGLVDVAIDTNKRVIEDQQLGVSTVLDDNYIYLYVRPDSPAREWLVEYADTTMDEFDQGGF